MEPYAAAPGAEPQEPLPLGPAVAALARCALRVAALLARRRIQLPTENVGRALRFADGSQTWVFRETRIRHAAPPADPCVLLVRFRLRGVRGRGHALFRHESLLNTVLFAGFPGLVTKWWLAHDSAGVYRGLYEWDGPRRAEAYARALWRVLALVSVPGSIGYHILPGARRADVLAGARPTGSGEWWRVTGVGTGGDLPATRAE